MWRRESGGDEDWLNTMTLWEDMWRGGESFSTDQSQCLQIMCLQVNFKSPSRNFRRGTYRRLRQGGVVPSLARPWSGRGEEEESGSENDMDSEEGDSEEGNSGARLIASPRNTVTLTVTGSELDRSLHNVNARWIVGAATRRRVQGQIAWTLGTTVSAEGS